MSQMFHYNGVIDKIFFHVELLRSTQKNIVAVRKDVNACDLIAHMALLNVDDEK